MKNIVSASILIATLSCSVTASATLIDRGNGMIYDSNQNLTWLQDMNYAKTSGYDDDGLMGWDNAMAWASNLTYGGHDDWRLPKLTVWFPLSGIIFDDGIIPDASLSSTIYLITSELYSVMAPECSVIDSGTSVICAYPWMSHFININTISPPFWYGNEEGNTAWAGQGVLSLTPTTLHPKSDQLQVWAVREGDVAGIPEPQSLALLVLGLACMGYIMRKPLIP